MVALASASTDGGGSGAANMYVRFVNNTMTFTKSHAINVVSGAGTTGGTMKVLIDSNIVGTSGTPDSGSKLGEGIQVTQQGKTVGTVTITNNTIKGLDNGAGEFGNRCIDVQTLGPTATGQPATPFDVKITGNNVDAQYDRYLPGSRRSTSGSTTRARRRRCMPRSTATRSRSVRVVKATPARHRQG